MASCPPRLAPPARRPARPAGGVLLPTRPRRIITPYLDTTNTPDKPSRVGPDVELRGGLAPGHPGSKSRLALASHPALPLASLLSQRGQGRPDSLVPVTVKMLQTAIAVSNVVRSRTDVAPASQRAHLSVPDPARFQTRPAVLLNPRALQTLTIFFPHLAPGRRPSRQRRGGPQHHPPR